MLILFYLVITFLGVFNQKYQTEKEINKEDDEDNGDEIGGLFKKVSKDQQKIKMDKANVNLIDSSLVMPWSNSVAQNWLEPQVCFKINSVYLGICKLS